MRSLLYVPANSARFIAKAHERGADCVVLDLEDSVAPSAKDSARAGLAAAVAAVRRGPAQVALRINARSDADIAAGIAAGLDLIVLPKCDSIADIDWLEARLRAAGAAIPALGVVESPAGVVGAAAFAHHPRLMGLSTGSEDLSRALGADPTPEMLRFPKLMVHYAAKAAGKLSFGLMRSIADYSDLDAIAAAAREARAHGFDGASCVHPSAVAIINAAFRPSTAEREWAERVLNAVSSDTGTVSLDGRMIDRPVIDRAKTILAQSEAP